VYVTLLQLAERPGARELAQVASTESQPVVDYTLMDLTLRGADRTDYPVDSVALADEALARITQAVTDADALIDGFLARRGYTLPLDPVPGVVAGWSRAIARYALHKARISDEKTDPIARDYRDALKLLQLTADGKFSLGGNDPQVSDGLGPIIADGSPRAFDDDTLSDFLLPEPGRKF
jgi:phage gp36-like protein